MATYFQSMKIVPGWDYIRRNGPSSELPETDVPKTNSNNINEVCQTLVQISMQVITKVPSLKLLSSYSFYGSQIEMAISR